MVEFVDFKCELCGGQFWQETKRGQVKETVEQGRRKRSMTELLFCMLRSGK